MHVRLIYSCVHPSPKLLFVQYALKRYNKNKEYLAKWEYGGINHFRTIFAHLFDADTDTRSSSRFIRVQNEIIGDATDNLAEHLPDKGHAMKCSSNTFFKVRDEDQLFNGVNCLSNLRIKKLISDIKQVVGEYDINGYGDPLAMEVCLKQLDAIVLHQYGNLDNCKHKKWCTFLMVKKENPSWGPDKIVENVVKDTSRPHGGGNLSLYNEGLMKSTPKSRERFNEKTIDKIVVVDVTTYLRFFGA